VANGIMIDGPLSFIIVFGLVGLAVLGALSLLACIVAACIPKYRLVAIRSWTFGIGGGLIVLFIISLLIVATLDGPDRTPSLFIEWGVVAFLAGFAAGGTINIGMQLFWNPKRPA
jgi:hypothetical protein